MRAQLLLVLFSCIGLLPAKLACQDIEHVTVETYYVSDANDATDTTSGAWGLAAGSITYRIFIDLCDSCALRAVYGREGHPLRFESTAPIFNHVDRPRIYGHEVNNNWLDQGTVALDSWLAMGAPSNQRYGVLKAEDADGSNVGGANNDGGSAEVPGGLLVNSTAEMGHALTERDGLLPLNGGAAVPVNFLPQGDDPSAAFFDSLLVNGFVSSAYRMGCATPGVKGPTPTNNVIVAQITTAGELAFELNVEIEHGDGVVVRYVARDTLLAPDETASGLLVYPPDCGCTDPNFLEYDPAAGCDDGSCSTTIVYGCLDPAACNYDPSANFNIDALCCYGPGQCNGLDVTIVCPDVSVQEAMTSPEINVWPNPMSDLLHVRALPEARFTLSDAIGRRVAQGTFIGVETTIPVGDLPEGAYLLRVRSGDRHVSRILLKD